MCSCANCALSEHVTHDCVIKRIRRKWLQAQAMQCRSANGGLTQAQPNYYQKCLGEGGTFRILYYKSVHISYIE